MKFRFGIHTVESLLPLPFESSSEVPDIIVHAEESASLERVRQPSEPLITQRSRLSVSDIRIGSVEAALTAGRIALKYGAGCEAEAVSLASGGLLSAAHLLKKLPVLHASGVEVEGGAVLFAGGSGIGKSTTACAVARYGACSIVLDDSAPLYERNGWHCISNSAAARLLPDAALIFGIRMDESSGEKCPAAAGASQAGRALPVRAIFTLKRASSLELTRLGSRDAFYALLPALWYPKLQQAALGPAHLERIADIARTVEVLSLSIPGDLSRLADAAGLILSAVQEIGISRSEDATRAASALV